jgi:hypothetical protein
VVRLSTGGCASNSEKSLELLKLLCHYLAYIGQQSGLLNPEWEQNATLNLVTSQWNTRPQYTGTIVETQSRLKIDGREHIEHTHPIQPDTSINDTLDSKCVSVQPLKAIYVADMCAYKR